MIPADVEHSWHVNWLKPGFPWNKQRIRPAEVGDGLCHVMTARKNILEDANYDKVVPNHFVIELTPENYTNYIEPLEKKLIQQWRDRLLEHLVTANSRIGRKEYRLGGQLLIEIRPALQVKENQARILCRVEPERNSAEGLVSHKTGVRRKGTAFLELIEAERRWPLYPGDNIIGRDDTCDIFLDLPHIQEKRLISAQHAIIRIKDGQSLLFDGSPSGKPSANGTYVNSRPIPAQGVTLKDGDIIILAALNPRHPRLDTPGVAAFRFRKALLDADQP